MAIKHIIVTTDDIDSTEDAATYRIINPSDDRVYSIDLGTTNFDKLMAALEPFLEHARPSGHGGSSSGSVRAPQASKTKSPGTRSKMEYDSAALKEWAEPQGKWTGKRPSYQLITEFQEAQAAAEK
jgi:hypothetical protein